MSKWVNEWKGGQERGEGGRKERKKCPITQGGVSVTKFWFLLVLTSQWGHTPCQSLYLSHMTPNALSNRVSIGMGWWRDGKSPGEEKFCSFLACTGSTSTLTPLVNIRQWVMRWISARGAGRHPRVSSLPLLARENFKPIWRCPWEKEKRREAGGQANSWLNMLSGGRNGMEK